MANLLTFTIRKEFHEWLEENSETSNGVWLLFGKKGGPTTLSAQEALEEALCFGWIDGLMQSIDSTIYKKYFAKRIIKSHWSKKNKKIAESLIEQGLMKQQGMKAIEQAKQNGSWNDQNKIIIDEEKIVAFKELIKETEPAYTNLLSMSMSIQITYAGYYFDAKLEKTKIARLEKIIERLNKNLKPMDKA